MKSIDDKIVNDLRRFEFFSQHIWPTLRLVFSKSVAPRCAQCVLSTNAPQTSLNRDGVCNFCEEFNRLSSEPDRKEWLARYRHHQELALDELLKSHQGAGKHRYDAIMLFSGGKDSVYILSRIRKNYPNLRLLLMTWNNGFYSKLSLDASKDIASKLDLDHVVYSPVSTLYKTLYRYTLAHVGAKGSYETVDRLDGTLNQLLGIHFAYELNIPLVLCGVDWAQNLIMQSQTYFVFPDEDIHSRILVDRMERRSGLMIKDIFNEEDQKLFWDGTGKDPDRIPKYVSPLAAWRPNKSEILKVLDEENLLSVKNSSPVLTNNQVLSAMTALDFKRIGYCSFEPEFSAMIRFGETYPAYWKNVFESAEFLVKTNSIVMRNSVDKIMKKLDLSYEDIGL
jgi:hypothetical protein